MSDAADPFSVPVELRDPARRLRGRLASPVTLWTSGPPPAPRGLTVSSLIVAEGEHPSVIGLVNPMSEFWDALSETRVFVVHVLERRHRSLAERFAGRMPAPGGLFADLSTERSDWGPKLAEVPNRAFCRLTLARPAGYQHLVQAAVEAVEVDELDDPLIHLQGRYRALRPRAR